MIINIIVMTNEYFYIYYSTAIELIKKELRCKFISGDIFFSLKKLLSRPKVLNLDMNDLCEFGISG